MNKHSKHAVQTDCVFIKSHYQNGAGNFRMSSIHSSEVGSTSPLILSKIISILLAKLDLAAKDNTVLGIFA